jgi:ribosomal protein S26
MAVRVECDNCGDQVKHEEVCEVVIISPKPGMKRRNDLYSILSGEQPTRKEHYQFCAECASMLALAIKSEKLRRRKGGLVV